MEQGAWSIEYIKNAESKLMNKIICIALSSVGVLLLALSLPAQAQQPKKVPRVGFLIASSASSQTPRLEAFKRGLRELGYVDGQNIAH